MSTPNFGLGEFLCRHCGGGATIVKPELLTALQAIRDDLGHPMIVNAGYRCVAHNAAVGGAPDSAHLTGEAADIDDPDGLIKLWMTEEMLIGYGMWAEDYRSTPTWIHLQLRPARHRIFWP